MSTPTANVKLPVKFHVVILTCQPYVLICQKVLLSPTMYKQLDILSTFAPLEIYEIAQPVILGLI